MGDESPPSGGSMIFWAIMITLALFVISIVTSNDTLHVASAILFVVLLVCGLVQVHDRNTKLKEFCNKEHGEFSYVFAAKRKKCTLNGTDYWVAP